MRGTTPPHAIAAPIRGAIGVVAPTVEEGEVAQRTVGVSTSRCHNSYIREGRPTLQWFSDLVTYLSSMPYEVSFWRPQVLEVWPVFVSIFCLLYVTTHIKTQSHIQIKTYIRVKKS